MTNRTKVEQMQDYAHRLSECLVLEETGVRDGDGYWHGSDPIDGIIWNMSQLWNGPEPVPAQTFAPDDL